MHYYTVKNMAMRFDFSESSFRYLIFNAKKNGLWPAIIRVGRKVMIDELKFARWLKDQECLMREEENKPELRI